MSVSEIESEFATMTPPDKIRLMEALWISLSRHEVPFESPAWHGNVLRERQARVQSGEAVFMDWETAKQQLRHRFK